MEVIPDQGLDARADEAETLAAPKGRGRLRTCKQCKFTCTDSIEFQQHRSRVHCEGDDASSKRAAALKLAAKKRSSRSESEISMDSMASERINGDEHVSMMNDENEEDRLVIAEDHDNSDGQDPNSVTPTRCGNIQNRTYVCSVCEFTSTSAKTYLHHQKNAHKYDFTIYECDICEYATKYKQKLPRHRKLHFTGQDGLLLQNSTFEDIPNNSLLNHSQEEDPSMLGDDEEEDMEEEEEPPVTMVIPQPVPETVSTFVGVVVEKKKKTRQEVDPAKYFEVVDDTGIKYACSSCGNVYKWRKSLNKHWKEKHGGEIPDGSKKPPGLTYLVNSGNHTMYGKRRIYSNSVLASITAPTTTSKPSSSHSQSPSMGRSETPVSMSSLLNGPSPVPSSEYPEPVSSRPVVFPKYIGPFVNNTTSPAYSSASTIKEYVSAHIQKQKEEAELERRKHRASPISNAASQDQPLDFSVRKDDNPTLDPSFFKVKMEPLWMGDEDTPKNESFTGESGKSSILQCTKCAFVAKTLVDYSSHMTLHLNRRAFKCAVCQEHFNGVEELNKHFLDEHHEKIQEHKDAIQKIPHGLQQTYHLLKMPLEAITNLSSQDLTSDAKQLKCNMCEFVAKWPAELQKHAVSHSEERPFMCMVCGSTYKWKWDLVKHFEKSHHTLPNPYKRRENVSAGKSSEQSTFPSEDSLTYSPQPDFEEMFSRLQREGEPTSKRRRMSDSDMPELIPKPLEDDHIAVFDENRDLGIYRKHLEAPSLNMERPSSVPTHFDSFNDDDSSNDDGLKMSHDQSLSDFDADCILYKHDLEYQIQRPVTEETQKAIAAAVRQRLNNPDLHKMMQTDMNSNNINSSCADILLPYKCPRCEYRARWPSEITQHMKNHSDEKPYHCPRCNYRSKWKWDVVKHLKRCGGGTIKDVIDTSGKHHKRIAPPNVMVMPEGTIQQQTPQPVAYLVSSNNNNESLSGQGTVIVPIMAGQSQDTPPLVPAGQNGQAIQPKLSNSSQPSRPGMPGTKQPVFRSLVNQGLYHCLECPFIGHSPAELKRHSVLHSESKPFTCGTCGYSSRWKCDLKKHMRTYNHFSSQSTSPGLFGDDSMNTDSDEAEKVEKTETQLYTCNKCPFATTKSNMLDLHMKIHSTSPTSSSPSKFRCKQCNFHVNDLSTFLQHRVTHSNQNAAAAARGSPGQSDSQRTDDMDVARLKHPRKAVKKLHCSKCEFSCFKRETMDLHEVEHEKELDFKCFYCDITVSDKESLLDHITTHSEFNPDEWETFFMEDEQSDDEVKVLGQSKRERSSTPFNTADHTVPSPPPLKMFHSSEQRPNTANSKDYPSVGPPQLHIPQAMHNKPTVMSSRPNPQSSGSLFNSISRDKSLSMHSGNIQQSAFRSSASKQVFEHSSFRTIQPAPASSKRFTCEWCEAMFAHITTLYQHAKNIHPLELQQQELAEATRSFTQTSAKQQLKQKQLDQSKFHEQQSRQQASHHHHLQHQSINARSSSPQYSTAKQSGLSGSPQYNTPKQSGLSENKKQFLESLKQILPSEQMKKGSFNLQNMSPEAITHALMKAKKTTSPQKKSRSFQCTKCPFTAPNAVTYLRHIERHGSNCKHTCWFCNYSIDRLNLLYQHMKGSHSDQWKESNTEVQLPQGPAPTYPIIVEDDPETMEKIRAENLVSSNSKMNKPVLILKERMTWKGVPIQICSMDGKKNYKCPKCSYVNSNIANAANHVRQHGSNRKYQCKYCDYCSDNLKLIYQHMDKVHPKEPAFIEVNKNVEVDLDEKESADVDREGDENEEAQMTCPKCPFEARVYDIYRAHVMMHSYNGQYKCEHCDYSVDDLAILTHHSVVHEKKEEVKERPFKERSPTEDKSLTLEKKQFTRMLNLKTVDEVQPASKTSSTPNKTAEIGSKLVTMQARHILHKSRMSGRVRYKCSRCPYYTFCKNNIIKHRKQHLVKRRYKCPLCNYSAGRAYLLQQHIKFHRTENSFSESSSEYLDVVLDPLDKNNEEFDKLTEEIEAEGHPELAGEVREDDEKMDDGEEVTDVEEADDEPEAPVSNMPVEMEADENVAEVSNSASASPAAPHRNYQCKECPFGSNSAIEFKKHSMLHGAGHRYKCEFCSYSLDRLNLLTQHRRLHSDEPDFEPAPPPSALLNLDFLNLEAEATGKAVEKVSSSLDNGDSTEMMIAEDGENELMRYCCTHCPFGSNALKSYNVHFQMHGLKKKYICDYCDWSIDRLNLLYQHRRVHSKQPGFIYNPDEITILNREFALEAPGKFEAQILSFAKDSNSPGADHHKIKQTPEKKSDFSCKNCPFTTGNKNSFAYHRMLHRMRARYMCPECSYSVDRWNLLNQHMRLHQDAKKQAGDDSQQQSQIKCPKCPYLSQSKEMLEAHLGMHGAENKFNCHCCDYSVDSINQLQQHLKVHEERSRSLLSQSMVTNSDPGSPDVVNPQVYFSSPDDNVVSDDSEDVELKCDRCPFSTTVKEELDRHENQHNTPDCFPCCYCDFSCSIEEELHDHIQVHFPGTPVDKELIKSIITKHQQEKNNNSLTETPAEKEEGKTTRTETSAPDSTVEEEQKSHKETAPPAPEKGDNSTSRRTKVYVCQYCEREFENKSLMMQHERQHLIGHQY